MLENYDECAPHGRAFDGTDDGPLLTDALVLLTKINYRSIVRVLAAMDAIREAAGVPSTDRLDFLSEVPTERLDPESTEPEHIQRSITALALCRQIAQHSGTRKHNELLHLSRFRASSGRK